VTSAFLQAVAALPDGPRKRALQVDTGAPQAAPQDNWGAASSVQGMPTAILLYPPDACARTPLQGNVEAYAAELNRQLNGTDGAPPDAPAVKTRARRAGPTAPSTKKRKASDAGAGALPACRSLGHSALKHCVSPLPFFWKLLKARPLARPLRACAVCLSVRLSVCGHAMRLEMRPNPSAAPSVHLSVCLSALLIKRSSHRVIGVLLTWTCRRWATHGLCLCAAGGSRP
jgi:hypothetical protein